MQTPLMKHLASSVLRPTLAPAAVGLTDAHCRLSPQGTTTACESIYSSVPADIFEANNKQAWLDIKSGYCHLCQEPVGSTLGVHIGDRDHTCLQYFLYLYASYPRGDYTASQGCFKGASLTSSGALTQSRRSASPYRVSCNGPLVGSTHVQRGAFEAGPRWQIPDVLGQILRCCPSLAHYATNHLEFDHLHVYDDALRRAEIEALLMYLSQLPHPALSHVLQGRSPFGFWYSGERMWKGHMTRLVSQLFPPGSAGVITNFTQKCWGRTNGERTYDALQLQRITAMYGWPAYDTKDKKAFYVRQLLWELLSVETRAEVDELTKHLASLTLRRMAFEMVFLQSMQFMNRVQGVYAALGYPTLQELQNLNLL